MPMKNPVHPGRILREDCIAPLGLTVKAAAEVLGVSRQALNNVVNEKADISPEMAIRIEKAFGGTADTWLRMQTAFNLAEARRHEHRIRVTRYRVLGTHQHTA
jgi:antitoxin HigA-1